MIMSESAVVLTVELTVEMKRVFKSKSQGKSNRWITTAQAISFIKGKGYNRTRAHKVLKIMELHNLVVIDPQKEKVVIK